MGIVTGYICLFCALLLLLKYVSRKMGWRKLNGYLMRFHKYAAFTFLSVGLVHFFLVIKVLDTRNLIVTVSGIIVLISGFAITIICHLAKDRKKEIVCHRLFSLAIAVFVTVHIVMYFVDFNSYTRAIGEITISEVDLNEIEDGEYFGSYDVGYINAKVIVTVKNHEIISVEILEHNNERGERAETITSDMISNQSIDVDAPIILERNSGAGDMLLKQ